MSFIGAWAGGLAHAVNNCTGATYYDADSDTCIACPAGYDDNDTAGKTSDTQCQIHCDAGTYVETPGITGYKRLAYIQSDGNVVLDTGYTLDEDDVLELHYKLTSAHLSKSGDKMLIRATNTLAQTYSTANKWYTRFGSSSSVNTSFNSTTQTEGVLILKKMALIVNENRILAPAFDSTLSGETLKIFGNISSGSPVSTSIIQTSGFSITRNNQMIMNLVPMQRSADGVIGMYDTVSGTFLTKTGSGSFVAGPEVITSCVNVGAGYWAAASTVSYGSTGTRNACPIGTYSNAINATSSATCVACSGATYSDVPGAGSCTACPLNYDYETTTSGKTSVTQCKTHCDGGTCVDGYTRLEYIGSTVSSSEAYIDTGINFGSAYTYEIKYMKGGVNNGIMGARVGSYNAQGNFSLTYNGSSTGMYSSTSSASSVVAFGDTTFGVAHTVKYQQSSGTLLFDGANYWKSNWINSVEIPYNVYLFAFNDHGAAAGSRTSYVRIYYYILKDSNGVVIQNLVPVRRNRDNVLGMYDTVSGTFFTNAGTGTFTAGADIGAVGGYCSNVGVGYYAAASTVNYGDTVARTACPVGTYSDTVNASSCTLCVGATYNDEPAAVACKACPTGYIHNTTAGKTSIGQCQIHCGAGTYVENTAVGDGYTPLEYIALTGTQYIDTGVVLTDTENIEHVMNIQSDIASGFRTWSGFMNTSGTTPRYGINFYNNKWMIGINITSSNGLSSDTNAHTVKFVTSSGAQTLYDTNGTTVLASGTLGTGNALSGNTLSLYIGARNNSGSPVNFVKGRIGRTYLKQNGVMLYNYIPAQRDSDGVVGMYDTVSGTFFTNAGTGTFTAGPMLGVIGGVCTNVGAGYYAAASTVNFGSVGTRNACPAGTTTVGYGHGADSPNDCGRTLHVGDNVLYMRKNKETSPSVGIDMGGADLYYISLSPTNHNMSPVHFWYNGAEYTAYDDSLFYNERSLGN